jgi:hypothetical protein
MMGRSDAKRCRVKQDDDKRGPPLAGPGLSKVRKAQVVVTRRALELVALRKGWWSSLLEEADIISEGQPMADGEVSVYYGSTSVRAAVDSDDVHELVQLVLHDPHARLRLLRLAHREAVSRAGASLNVMHAEIVARALVDGACDFLAIDIDVSAALAVDETRADDDPKKDVV